MAAFLLNKQAREAGKNKNKIIWAGKKYLYQPGVFKYHKVFSKMKTSKIISIVCSGSPLFFLKAANKNAARNNKRKYKGVASLKKRKKLEIINGQKSVAPAYCPR